MMYQASKYFQMLNYVLFGLDEFQFKIYTKNRQTQVRNVKAALNRGWSTSYGILKYKPVCDVT